MQTFIVELKSDPHKSFRCQKAADALDINLEKKLIHKLEANIEFPSTWKIGLIIGASGSGKTTLAKKMFSENCFSERLNSELPIIEQFPNDWTYEQCSAALNGIGLTQVVCWIRPAKTLSNGQRARAEAALALAHNESVSVIDEWTSVVDRTVAKAMSHCVRKYANKQTNKQIVLCACHNDIIEWLDPDWIFDCNKQEYINRTGLSDDERKKKEQLVFRIERCDKSAWQYFSKYHYLSDKLPGGIIETFGLFHQQEQIGFQCFANYVPYRKNERMKKMQMHSNRTVIHPDYAGLGLGVKLIDETSKLMSKQYDVRAKFSSIPVYKALLKSSNWQLVENKVKIGKTKTGGNMTRDSGFRENIRTFSFKFVG